MKHIKDFIFEYQSRNRRSHSGYQGIKARPALRKRQRRFTLNDDTTENVENEIMCYKKEQLMKGAYKDIVDIDGYKQLYVTKSIRLENDDDDYVIVANKLKLNHTLVDLIIYFMMNGVAPQGKMKYGVSKQNIAQLIDYDDFEIEREDLEFLIDTLESDGLKWKYETDEEFLNDGLIDPQK